MNDRSYERAPAAIGQEAQLTQAGFVNRVFGWMTGGLALTAGISYAIANSTMQDFVIQNRGAFLGLLIVEVLLVIGLSAAINKISSFVAGLGFALFAALNGVTLSWIFMAYDPTAIYRTFFTTSLMFGGVGAFGYVTKKDLSGIGGMCGMALWGLIVAMLINMFWANSTFSLLISICGVVLFTGLTAWDMQKIKLMSLAVGEGQFDAETGKKVAIFGALELYLDFINLFLFLLRIFGNRR